jgi:hypothetical protein
MGSGRMRARTRLRRNDPNWLPIGYRNAADFNTEEQIMKETFQRYNGGAYWRWIPFNQNDPRSPGYWEAHPVNNNGNNYWNTYRRVQLGNPPAEWN